MDPIYYQVNQTRLTENTQKSSDNLRIQQNKETKRKAQRAGDVEKSATASDMTSMSDDMLGDMDPDDYGGSSSQQFAQMWKEQFGGDSDQADRQDPSEEDTEQEGEQVLEDEEALEEELEAAPPERQAPEASPATQSNDAKPSVVAHSSSSHAQPSDSPNRGADPSPSPGQPGAPVSSAAPVRAAAAETVALTPNPPDNEPPRKVVVPPTGPAPKSVSAPQKSSGPLSLLDFSSGFLIAEDAHWDESTADSNQALDEPMVAEAALPEDLAFLLDKLIQGDATHPSYRRLQQLLSRFGIKVLRTCLEAQTRVYLLPPGERLQAHPLLAHTAEGELVDAAYLPQVRLCLFEDRCLSEPPYGFHPVFYYFAHAFDHALGGESFASLKSPAVRASYEACLEGSHRFGDLMAANSPAHYFAQAVESYLAENDCFQPLWTHHDLYDFDRSMYDYVEYLLGQKRAG